MEYWNIGFRLPGVWFQAADSGLCPASVALICDFWQFVLSTPITPLLQHSIGFYEII